MRILALLVAVHGAVAAGIGAPNFSQDWTWGLQNFSNFITFGDSYTDESRLGWFISHNGTGPPTGVLPPFSNSTAGGGIVWDRWVSYYTGAKLYDYAVSGAVCTNNMIQRFLDSIHGFYPDVADYQITQFQADLNWKNASTGTNTLYTDRHADNTVYALWIGTNDVGVDALLTDSTLGNSTITNYTECVFSVLDSLYRAGGRYFVLLNLAPLQLTPLYGLPGAGGLTASHYWPDKPSNITEISNKIKEYTTTINNVFELQVPYELFVAYRYPGASFAIYDVHGLITDIYNRPSLYLNGTSPPNVTGQYFHCDLTGNNCTTANASYDSFLWYDELHPTQRTDQIIAQNFVDVIKGNSTWATYW